VGQRRGACTSLGRDAPQERCQTGGRRSAGPPLASEGIASGRGAGSCWGLLRDGWTESETKQFISAVSQAACDDEVAKRGQAGHYTNQRLGEAQSSTGWPRLAELVGVGVVERTRKWLGRQGAEAESDNPLATDASTIFVGPGRLPQVVDKAEDVLLSRAEEQKVFQRGGELVLSFSSPRTYF
jgi:hypothetical protein